jgi:trimethylamine--corrinoid protein Co-methyltransferase
MTRSIFLSPQKSEKLHEASLRVLEQTGVKLDHEESIDLFLRAGAKKDSEGRILIPKKLVSEALEKIRTKKKETKQGLLLYKRDGDNPIRVEIGKTYYGPGSDALYNIDLKTKERRRSTVSDIQNNVRIADALPGFEFIMSMALPDEVESSKLYATIFAEMVKNTSKPIITTCTSLKDLQQIHEIASIVRGDRHELKQRPFFIAYLEPLSPLIMDKAGCERLLFCADNGIPMLYAAGANCGSGAPITPEGGVVQGGAESLAGLVLATLKSDQVQFIYGANTSAMDMKSTIVSYGDPTWFKTTAMYADLGRFYKLPSWGTAGSSDSFSIDAQAAMEAYEGISLALMSGTTLAHDVGYLAHGELYDARMMVLTDMMIGRVMQILKPVDLSEDALAVDVINEVARSGGLYLTHPHTQKKFREALWLPPKYINRKHFTLEKEDDLSDLLSDEVERILSGHTPKELPQITINEIDRYLESI